MTQHWTQKTWQVCQNCFNLVELADQTAQFERMVMKFQKNHGQSPLDEALNNGQWQSWSQKNPKHHFHLHVHGINTCHISRFQSQEIYITAFSNLQKHKSILFLGGFHPNFTLTLRNMKFHHIFSMNKTPGCLGFFEGLYYPNYMGIIINHYNDYKDIFHWPMMFPGTSSGFTKPRSKASLPAKTRSKSWSGKKQHMSHRGPRRFFRKNFTFQIMNLQNHMLMFNK